MNKLSSLFFIAVVYSSSLVAQLKQHINPDGVNKPKTYSQVVKVNSGTMIFTSGIVADDANGNIIGKGDLKIQVKQAFENFDRINPLPNFGKKSHYKCMSLRQ